MSQLILEPTSTAQWHALVSEAEAAAACSLDETLESYLVFLLMRFAARPDLAGRVMAVEYLRGATSTGQAQVNQLRDVGDQCLLFSGFYPQLAERRHVRISYYVDLGRGAYGLLAERLRHASAEIYQRLCEGFVALMDVLHAMRALDGDHTLAALQAHELWADTGSQAAWKQLRAVTGGIPVRAPSQDEKPH